MKVLCLSLLSLPAWANLYFYMPVVQPLLPGEIVVDSGAVYSFFDHPDLGEEDRYYLPDMLATAQIAPRIGLHAHYFGIYRDLPEAGLPQSERSDFRFGDVLLGGSLDLWHSASGHTIKAWTSVKIPNAPDDALFGSDRTDVFLAGSWAWRNSNWQVDSLLRLDILGRPATSPDGQWDYLTLGTRLDRRLSARLDLSGEIWHRTRSSDTTTLYTFGLQWQWTRRWDVRASYGRAQNDHYVPSLDAMLQRQITLRFTWRLQPSGWTKWLQNP